MAVDPTNLTDLFGRVRDGMYPSWNRFKVITNRREVTFRKWVSGERTPIAETMGRLALYLRDQADRLRQLADEVEEAAVVVAEHQRKRAAARTRARARRRSGREP